MVKYTPASFRFEDFELDLGARELRRGGEAIPLQPKVFAVLALLVERAGEALGKDDFLDAVWSGRFVTENVLSRCILQLRKALGDDAGEPRFIRTVRGHGYQFVADLDDRMPAVKSGPGRVSRLAVLPFRPLVPEVSNPALELGLTETLVNDLSRIEDLTVRPLAAVRDASADLAADDPIALARKLAVEVVIEGSLQIAGNRLRLSVRALRAADGTALLSERFDAELADIFDVQDRLCGALAQSLLIHLSKPEDRTVRRRRRTRDLRAYRAYSDGRLKLAEHRVESAKAALEDFQRAVGFDREYVEALVGVAEANDLLATLGVDPAHYHERCREAARRALSLDPDRARACSALGKVAWQYEWGWSKAEYWLTRATELDPEDADAHIALSDFLCFTGRGERAVEVAERAGAVNPFSPWIQSLIVQALLYGGRVEEALQQAQHAVHQSPGFGFARFYLARSLMAAGRELEGLQELRHAVDITGRQDFMGALGYALAVNGEHDRAREMLDAMKNAQNAGEPVPSISLAMIHAGLGNEDAALEQLKQVYEDRSWHVLLLGVEPAFEKVRARPEGLALLEALRLPPR